MDTKGGYGVQDRRNETEQERKARDARNAYYKEWRKKNPDKVKAYQMRFWANRAAKEAQEKPSE